MKIPRLEQAVRLAPIVDTMQALALAALGKGKR